MSSRPASVLATGLLQTGPARYRQGSWPLAGSLTPAGGVAASRVALLSTAVITSPARSPAFAAGTLAITSTMPAPAGCPVAPMTLVTRRPSAGLVPRPVPAAR